MRTGAASRMGFLWVAMLLAGAMPLVGRENAACAEEPAADTPAATFTNPIVRSLDTPDPWVIYHDGWYYFTATPPPGGLWIWKSRTLTQMESAERVKVWTAPKDGPQSRQIWAPELHRINGRWYLYYTASDGNDRNHRHYVLEAETDDPLGPYIDRGRVDPDLDSYAIDGSVLQLPDGRLYWMYTTGRLEIAPMLSPTRVDGSRRALLAAADKPWERGWVEAPQALLRNGRIFVIYSAGHSGTPHYVLGLLEAKGDDLLNPATWVKHPEPVFAPAVTPQGAAYTTGHNCFTVSPDGREDWIVYHAKEWRDEHQRGFAGRTSRAQPFTWTADGLPFFGQPIPAGVPIPRPSGELEAEKAPAPAPAK